MPHIILNQVSVGYHSVLFKDLTISLNESMNLGIVGNSGSGKTTLLNCLAKKMTPISGEITFSKGSNISFVNQILPDGLRALTMTEVILTGIQEDLRIYESWKVDMLLDLFEAPLEMRSREMESLSGGWRRITQILKAWASDPDILILDEPTNDLDLEKIIALEKLLKEDKRKKIIIIVSHDRQFLNQSTNCTLFLRQNNSKLYSHPYEKAYEILVSEDEALFAEYEKNKKEIERLYDSAHKLRQIGVNNYSSSALRKSIQINERANKIKEEMPDLPKETDGEVKLHDGSTHAKHIININSLTVKAPDGKELFRIGRLEIFSGDRLVILGKNGTGKSQFVQQLHNSFLNANHALPGVYIAPSVIIGYLDQSMSSLPKSLSLREYISHSFLLSHQNTISTLISAGFPVTEQGLKISELSPGQQSRLILLSLRLMKPNLYFMDEPTNFLDIPGQEQLENAILQNEATYILVSHDRKFINKTGNRYLVINEKQIYEIYSPEEFYNSLGNRSSINEVVEGRPPL